MRKLQRFLRDSELILAAGMPRSASTWVYNVARLLMARQPGMKDRFSCGWVADWKKIPKKPYLLIKIHDFDRVLANSSRLILYSYRDIRDVLASLNRKFDHSPSMDQAARLIAQDQEWSKVAHVAIRYESMLDDRHAVVNDVARAIGVQDVDPAEIVEQVAALSCESRGEKNEMYDPQSLYHRGHMTDGRHGSWHGVLDAELTRALEQEYHTWLEERGYLTALAAVV